MNEKMQEMERLVDRIAQHQTDLGLSDNAFVARYQTHLNSAKTWGHRLKVKNFAEMKVERWLSKLRAFVRELDGQAEGMRVAEELPITQYALLLYERLQGTATDRRIAWLIGDYGVGKSWALRHLAARNRGTTAYVEALETWRENKGRIIRGFAKAVGLADGNSPGDLFEGLLDHLRANPITLLVDEAHHGGVMILKMMKSIVNQTRAKIICGTYPTALRKLETSGSDAVAEARQVLGRSVKPIDWRWAGGVGVEDVKAYLQHVGGLNGAARAAAEKVTPMVRGDGNLRQLADAMDDASLMAGDEDINQEQLVSAVQSLGSKGGRK